MRFLNALIASATAIHKVSAFVKSDLSNAQKTIQPSTVHEEKSKKIKCMLRKDNDPANYKAIWFIRIYKKIFFKITKMIAPES